MEFSYRTRQKAWERFQNEEFDLLIIGGGITGAAAARDAVSRGLKVALVEKNDFASGTSSKSSKLIHGGLRYLQTAELGLVFEALSERTHLLKTSPHMVRPLQFFLPVYKGDSKGVTLLSFGLWLYDILALGRSPGYHRLLTKNQLLKQIPFLKPDKLRAGFRYYDASMWDDVLAVETLRAASLSGAAVTNYVEAVAPTWNDDHQVTGFKVKDNSPYNPQGEIIIKAKRTVVCAGPWTDKIGMKLSAQWRRWLLPSKGVHLIFDLKRIPVPGAMVMSHPSDGRIAFVIPRPDYGDGVVIVGTTDGPTPQNPELVDIEKADVDYLMNLLKSYFPDLNLTNDDIVSAYVGVRPLMGTTAPTVGSDGGSGGSLQKVSREHYIGEGPGGTIMVAGGKYTTHRTMAEEIIDEVLGHWKRKHERGLAPAVPPVRKPNTKPAVNPAATQEEVEKSKKTAEQEGIELSHELLDRYGAEALEVARLKKSHESPQKDPDGYPGLVAQMMHNMKTSMVMRLEDFYFRRSTLFMTRKDHGLPWAEEMAQVWAKEMGLSEEQAQVEAAELKKVIQKRSEWVDKLKND